MPDAEAGAGAAASGSGAGGAASAGETGSAGGPDPVGDEEASRIHPGRVLGTLAGEARLRVFAALVLAGTAAVDDVAAATGLDRREARRALDALAGAGLAEDTGDGRWAPVPATLREAARRASGMVVPPDPGAPGASGEDKAVLRAFVVGGRLERLPAQRSKRLVVLDYVAQRFVPGRTYDETEVNRIAGELTADHATLRRALVDDGFLERREGRYWRAGGTFELG